MKKMLPDIIISLFIWVLFYFMFRPAQDILGRAAENDSNTLEILIIIGFIATIIIDLMIRLKIEKKNKKKNDEIV